MKCLNFSRSCQKENFCHWTNISRQFRLATVVNVSHFREIPRNLDLLLLLGLRVIWLESVGCLEMQRHRVSCLSAKTILLCLCVACVFRALFGQGQLWSDSKDSLTSWVHFVNTLHFVNFVSRKAVRNGHLFDGSSCFYSL
jgi:hypothetical protein